MISGILPSEAQQPLLLTLTSKEETLYVNYLVHLYIDAIAHLHWFDCPTVALQKRY